MIRKATPKDTEVIASIYNYYVKNAIATFEEEPISVKEMEKNITKAILWLVYVENEKVIGYAYASKWKARSAYRFTTECSVYLEPNSFNKGLGTKLYTHLFSALKKLKINSVIGGISLPNEVSQKLHENFGFEKVAHFKKIGFKFNKWIDVGYWQLFLT